MYKRDMLLLLEDMLESASKIHRYTMNYSFDDFIGDEKTVDAVIRNFEIIGEAANRIDPDFKIKFPEVEWKRLRGLRNRIIHEYFGIDFEIVWSIIKNDLPDFHDHLEALIDYYRNSKETE